MLQQQGSSANCHYSCSQCIGNSYLECSQCKYNRELHALPSKEYGSCDCPAGSSEILQEQCQNDTSSEQIVSNVQTTHTIGAISTGIALVTSGNPAMVLAIADTGQTLSYLQFINRQNAMGMDKGSDSFSQSHPSQIFQNPALGWFSETSTTT